MPTINIRRETMINRPFEKVVDFAVKRKHETAGIWQNEVMAFHPVSGDGGVGTKIDMDYHSLGETHTLHTELLQEEIHPDRCDSVWRIQMDGALGTHLDGNIRYSYRKKGTGTRTGIEYNLQCDKNESLVRQVEDSIVDHDLRTLKAMCEHLL